MIDDVGPARAWGSSPAPDLAPSSEGVQVAVHDLGGPEGPGAEVLLFSHATGFHGLGWRPLAEHLTDRYRCLALDYRGHGVTRTPQGASLAWSSMANDAIAVLEHIRRSSSRPVHGIGHSLGGAMLALAADRRPDWLRSLWLYEPVIVPAPVGAFGDGPNPLADGAARRRSSFASFDAALANFAGKSPLNQLDPAALRAYVDGGFALREDGTVELRCAPATEAAVFRGAAFSGVWSVLPTLHLPVAVVAGRTDSIGPVTFAEPTVAALPNATLVERRHLGHFGPLEDPSGMARDVHQWVAAVRQP
jgi:pimeloyl-ACP methyl ester carboxylesterase